MFTPLDFILSVPKKLSGLPEQQYEYDDEDNNAE
jgi:hypothetical protein